MAYLFTSESAPEPHPDRIAAQLSDPHPNNSPANEQAEG